MNFKKTLTSVLAVASIATAMIAPAANAAIKGKVTYHHGVISSQKTTYGSIDSTKYENSMGIDGWIKATAGEWPKGTTYLPYLSDTNCNILVYAIQVGKTKGSSSFNYYVDGSYRHTSTAPWNFDFR